MCHVEDNVMAVSYGVSDNQLHCGGKGKLTTDAKGRRVELTPCSRYHAMQKGPLVTLTYLNALYSHFALLSFKVSVMSAKMCCTPK